MKLTKLFGVVLGLHLSLILILIVQPGCNTTQPPTRYEQGGITGWNKAASLDEVIPENGENRNLDPAFNDDVAYDASMPEANLPPVDYTNTVDSLPSVEVTGAAFENYTVQSGDSMWAISRKFSLSLNDLLSANSMGKNEILTVGRVIRIPVQSTVAEVKILTPEVYQPSGYNAQTTTYKVSGGDTLSGIARRFDTTVKAIKAANNKVSDMIRVGEELLLPVSETTAPTTGAVLAPADPVQPVIAPAVSPVKPAVEMNLVKSQPAVEPAPNAAQSFDADSMFEDAKEVPVLRQVNP
jgi:LysM repeat protein